MQDFFKTITKPIVFFDLESTGLDVNEDRITEGYFKKIYPDGKIQVLHVQIKPEISITEASALITHISNETVKDWDKWIDRAKEVYDFINGYLLITYNGIKFDLPLLTNEFYRAGLNFGKPNVIDLYKMWCKNEHRKLTDAYTHFCGKKIKDAHRAENDVIPMPEILNAQFNKYGVDVIKESVVQFENIPYQVKRDSNKKLIWNIGKYKGELISSQLGFFDWMKKKWDQSSENIRLFNFINEELKKENNE